MIYKKKALIALLIMSLMLQHLYLSNASLAISISDMMIVQGRDVTIYYDLPEDGRITLSLYEDDVRLGTIHEEDAKAGFNEFVWDGLIDGVRLNGGMHELELSQRDSSIRMAVLIEVNDQLQDYPEAAPEIKEATENAQPEPTREPAAHDDGAPASDQPDYATLYPTPAKRSTFPPHPAHKNCFWCTPMDIRDEEAVWAMLTAPIYTVDEKQNLQVIIREEPSESSAGVGVVTGTSMGLHVLENLKNGWSRVECYSASFFDSKIKAWNQFVTGYIKTSLIKKKTPNQEMGIVIDKLTQTLYLFRDGHLFSTLAVSTGLYNPRQPYNETRSGEFLLVSKVGDFKSDAMICRFAIRFDGGDLLHEVPHVLNADGGKNYKATEGNLGSRKSHGCIRVQRKENQDGINMLWLWKNLKVSAQNGVRIVIWEDFEGRQIEIPSDDIVLYYNEDGGEYYHCAEECKEVSKRFLPMKSFTYGELENSAYAKLSPCPRCQPVRRRSVIQEINELHRTSSPGMVSDYHGK